MSVIRRQVSPPMVLQVPGERGSECEENVSLDMGTESDDESDEVEMQSPGRMSPGSQTSHGLEPTVELQLAQMGQLVAESISKMEVTNPEVLRATRAFHAFQNFAVALRVGCDGDFYGKSRKSARISTFWSHSWHGGHWNKIITLLFFYNGTIAILVGFLMATALGLLFFSSDILPGVYRGFHELWSTWSLCGGSLAAGFVFLLWRPQTLVFLDRICISQNDSDLKTQAIFSLAGLLKNSDTMLILWDPTWTERLWCLFELAAFLKSKKTQKQTLIVQPIFLGPISVTLFVTMFAFGLPINLVPIDDWTTALVPIAFALLSGVAVGFWTLSTLRSYFRDLDTMKEQLLSISFDRTRAACCDQNHVGPGGQVLLCDRRVVKTCVQIWFGSQEAFEQTVRSDVLNILTRDLSERVFTTRWLLGTTTPIIWMFIDLGVSQKHFVGHTPLDNQPTLSFLLEGMTVWILLIPALKELLIPLCRLTRRRPTNLFCEILKNCLVVFLAVVPIWSVIGVYILTRFVNQDSALERAAAFVGCVFFVAGCTCLLGFGLRSLLKRPGW